MVAHLVDRENESEPAKLLGIVLEYQVHHPTGVEADQGERVEAGEQEQRDIEWVSIPGLAEESISSGSLQGQGGPAELPQPGPDGVARKHADL